jgi:hypothetical protein
MKKLYYVRKDIEDLPIVKFIMVDLILGLSLILFISDSESKNNKWDNEETDYYCNDYSNRYPNAKMKKDKNIWDTPYSIDEDQDNFPIANPRIFNGGI